MVYGSRFEAEFRKFLDERISVLIQSMLNRAAVPDMSSYSFLAGQIDALRFVVPEICDEANRAISGEPTDGV